MKKSKKIIIIGVIIVLIIAIIAVVLIIKNTKLSVLLNTVVKKGDYIDYPVMYNNVANENNTNNGWRVLYIDNGNVKIISEGIVFKYKHERDAKQTVDNLLNNFIEIARKYDTRYGADGYMNEKYAISSKSVTKEDVEKYMKREIVSSEIIEDELVNINSFYWLANERSTSSVLAINENGYLYDYMNYKFGVRAVVTLDSNVFTNKGDGSANNPYKLVK